MTKFAQSSIFRSPNDHQSNDFMVTLLQISCVILELADLLFSDFLSLKGKPCCQHKHLGFSGPAVLADQK